MKIQAGIVMEIGMRMGLGVLGMAHISKQKPFYTQKASHDRRLLEKIISNGNYSPSADFTRSARLPTRSRR